MTSVMLTAKDLFCGGGGSSKGMEEIPGVQVRMASNHWRLAVDTHQENLPHADHDCADLSQVDPRRYPRTDILWASPECTNHSQAKGKRRIGQQMLIGETPDPAADRSRATMWDVVRFAEHHRYAAIVVENVVDAFRWELFPAWRAAVEALGYEMAIVWLNSMHAQAFGMPAPQSRDRMYVVCWRKGNRAPDFGKWTRPSAWCPGCEQMVRAVQSWKRPDRPRWGRYRQQYVYRCPSSTCRHRLVEPGWLPAASAIDWALPGERIGDRAKPLAAKTLARIEAGLRRYAQPVHVEAAGNTYERPGYHRAWPVTEPFKTLHTTPSKGVAYPPLIVQVEGRDGKHATAAGEPIRTQTARNETAIAVPPMLVPAGGTWNDAATSLGEPMRTRTTRDNEALVIPLRRNNTPKPTSHPLDTIAAAGNHHALVMRNNGSRGDGGEMSTPVDEPVRTVTTAGHQSLIRWDHHTANLDRHLVIDYNGPARTVADPLPTQTTIEGDAVASLPGDLAIAVDDCYFRMLEPHEIKVAMAFPAAYVLLGTKRDQVRLAGNAVTPPAARDLMAAVAESLGAELHPVTWTLHTGTTTNPNTSAGTNVSDAAGGVAA